MFDKKDRSKFKYWFAHWCSFQMIALNLGAWKPKYLLHDIEKPFMLYWNMWFKGMKHEDAYKKVQKFHRKHNRHHLEYVGNKDYEAMIIDWECSRFTKTKSPLTAKQQLEKLIDSKDVRLTHNDVNIIQQVLYKLKLEK